MQKTICLLLLSLCFLFSCAKKIEVGNGEKATAASPAPARETGPSSWNKADIKQQENVIEVHQEFRHQNEKKEWLSFVHELGLKDVSFVRMSAFCLDLESSYILHYRIYEKGQWGAWAILPESKEKVNPDRKVFSGLNLFQDIEKIQFKSTNSTQSPVVFRLFVAYHQK